MIEYWVHLKCAGIRRAQYTYTWTCHLHKESRLTRHTDITPHHHPRPWTKPPTHSYPTPPIPPQPKHRQTFHTTLVHTWLVPNPILSPHTSYPAPSQTHTHSTHSTCTSHPTHHTHLYHVVGIRHKTWTTHILTPRIHRNHTSAHPPTTKQLTRTSNTVYNTSQTSLEM